MKGYPVKVSSTEDILDMLDLFYAIKRLYEKVRKKREERGEG